jgi:hypothetical protein
MAREQDTPVTDSSGESWTTVRRSVPAEHIADVPDGAIVYACWIPEKADDSRHLTVYSTEDCHFIVLGNKNGTSRTMKVRSGDIRDIATEVRDNWEEFAAGKSLMQVQAHLSAGGTAQITADNLEEAQEIVNERVVGEVKTLTVNGIEVAVRFDELPDFEVVSEDKP